MNSIGFPKMFNGRTSTNVIYNKEATISCLHLLLNSEVRELFGDPDFGIRLKKYAFEQNNYILKDILIDEIYTQIKTFCPQVYIDRKDINITQSGNKLYANISCRDRLDFSLNTYNLVLFEENE